MAFPTLRPETPVRGGGSTPDVAGEASATLPTFDVTTYQRQASLKGEVAHARSGEGPTHRGLTQQSADHFLRQIVENDTLRGLPTEQRRALFTQQLAQLAETHNLPTDRKAELQATLLRFDTEYSRTRQEQLSGAIAKLAAANVHSPLTVPALKYAYAELQQIAGQRTSPTEWSGITERFEAARESARRDQMTAELRAFGAHSAELYKQPDTAAIQAGVSGIREKFSDVSVQSSKELVAAFKAGHESEIQSKISQRGYVERTYYQARRMAYDLGDWLNNSLESIPLVGTKIRGAIDTVKSVGLELVDAAKGLERLKADVKSWCANKVVQGLTAAQDLCVQAVTDPVGFLTTVKDTAVSAASTAWNVTTWGAQKAADGAIWLAKSYIELQKNALLVGWDCVKGAGSVGLTCLSGIRDVGSALLGRMSWSEVASNFQKGVLNAATHFDAAFQTVSTAAQATWGFIKSTSDSMGISSMIAGLYHMQTALPMLAWDVGKVAFGQGTFKEAFSNFGGKMQAVGNGFVGAAVCFSELVGLTDLALAAKHTVNGLACYGRGEDVAAALHLAQATMHGAFAALSAQALVATVATGGAAVGSLAAVAAGRIAAKAAMKQVVSVAAKQFFKTAAKEGTVEAGKALLKQPAMEFLQQAGKHLGDSAVRDMGAEAIQLVSKEMGAPALRSIEQAASKALGSSATKDELQMLTEGMALQALLRREGTAIAQNVAKNAESAVIERGAAALSHETMEAEGLAVSKVRVKQLLDSLKYTDSIDEHAFVLLKNIDGMGTAKHAKQISQLFGLTESAAKEMSLQMKAAVAAGKSDAAMREILTGGTTERVTKNLLAEMEQPFQKELKSQLTKNMDEPLGKAVRSQAEKAGKSVDEFADELVEAGWKGSSKGGREAVEVATREGVERAFKRFRERGKLRGHLSGSAQHPDSGVELTASHIEDGKTPTGQNFGQAIDRAIRGGEEAMSKSETIDLGGGKYKTINKVFDSAANRWVVTSSTVGGDDGFTTAA
jgi:hypothetical protein